MGRPSKYDPAYCDKVVELGKEGMSVVEIACQLGVARSTLEEAWTSQHPEFSEAFARAREESQSWWERAGREGLKADKFNAQIWSRSMAARFPHDWRETTRQEHTGKDGGPIEQRIREDADVVTGAIAGLAQRARAAGVAGETQH
jgi:lambda repressor-like predicted transcriptional regulator